MIDPDGKEPTPWEAAMLAKAVYGEEIDWTKMNGWKISSSHGVNLKGTHGFKSQVYERTVDGKTEYVYAFAGTENVEDAIEDIKQASGLSKQVQQATDNGNKLAKSLKGKELTFVGHSLLGGLLSTSAALETEGRAININPAWLSLNTVMEEGLLFKSANVDNYTIFGEALDTFQRVFGKDLGLFNYGKTHYLNSTEAYIPVYGPIKSHTIDQAIEEIEDVPEYQ